MLFLGYTQLVERAGSILQENEDLDVWHFSSYCDIVSNFTADQLPFLIPSYMPSHSGDPAATRTLEPLKLRYFSPSELLRIFAFDTTRVESVSRLMDPSAPGLKRANSQWPDTVSLKSKYKLIGNSVNVHVVQQLIEYLFLEPEAVQITDASVMVTRATSPKWSLAHGWYDRPISKIDGRLQPNTNALDSIHSNASCKKDLIHSSLGEPAYGLGAPSIAISAIWIHEHITIIAIISHLRCIILCFASGGCGFFACWTSHASESPDVRGALDQVGQWDSYRHPQCRHAHLRIVVPMLASCTGRKESPSRKDSRWVFARRNIRPLLEESAAISTYSASRAMDDWKGVAEYPVNSWEECEGNECDKAVSSVGLGPGGRGYIGDGVGCAD